MRYHCRPSIRIIIAYSSTRCAALQSSRDCGNFYTYTLDSIKHLQILATREFGIPLGSRHPTSTGTAMIISRGPLRHRHRETLLSLSQHYHRALQFRGRCCPCHPRLAKCREELAEPWDPCYRPFQSKQFR